MLVIGEGSSKEVIKVHEVISVGPDTIGSVSLKVHGGKATGGHTEKVAIYRLGRQLCPETELARTSITDFQPPNCEKTPSFGQAI